MVDEGKELLAKFKTMVLPHQHKKPTSKRNCGQSTPNYW